jgi:Heparinase II/III-like protein/Heparinase II/III N-terminus
VIQKLQLYYNTLKYLRREQIAYRLFYFVRSRWRKMVGFSYEKNVRETSKVSLTSASLFLENSISSPFSYVGKNVFTFLNLSKQFDNDIDWEFGDYGKLWTYNLTYFDFLNQQNTEGVDFTPILDDFIQKLPQLKNANEPFPISLRGINWIKYFIKNKIQNPIYDRSLFHQYQILADNIEYHLLGNHLLENGFSMLFGAVYFQDGAFFKIAQDILMDELEEQILEDGAHFELCPMYHKIMLFRVLDCYNLLENNTLDIRKVSKEKIFKLRQLLKDKAVLMLSWLTNMTYSDGTTPHFGDSTEGIAPTSTELFEYAQRLNISYKTRPLSTSGFRKLKNEQFELVAKVGKIGPDYIPGHAHADSLSFELRNINKPFLVDMGISTYETNERRQLERSTSSHNTVEIQGKNSSEVWGSFRVGNRAKATILKDTDSTLWAVHDGYKKKGKHERQFVLTDHCLEIIDKTAENVLSKAYWHFPPEVSVTIHNNCVQFEGGEIKFFMSEKDNLLKKNIELANYLYPTQFNTYLRATKIIVKFNGTLKTQIYKA